MGPKIWRLKLLNIQLVPTHVETILYRIKYSTDVIFPKKFMGVVVAIGAIG